MVKPGSSLLPKAALLPKGVSLPLALLVLSLLGLAFSGCLEKEGLTERTTAPDALAGPDCASCHPYPLRDTNHTYHLYKAGSVKSVNGPITCLDCHSTAIAHRPVRLADSIFFDGLNEWSSLDFPDDAEIRTYPLLRVDSVVQNRPLLAPARPGKPPEFEEYITSLAHMNGTVDVVFDPGVTDTSGRFNGKVAEWMPKQETCSAMSCHPNENPYWRFADSARGLRELTGQDGDTP